ncbi:hypothetical protein I4U23_012113 [Adineta vaga]|nr:hypothetical protein I4U23_012113 [Adineta vaga]
MNFESLPNSIILILFEYFSLIELFDYFSCHEFKLHQFVNLQSITISNIKSKEIFDEIIIECSYLTHFTLLECAIKMHEHDNLFNFVDVFTIPYAFEKFWEDNICLVGKSTALYDNEYLRCPEVKTLNYGSSSFTDPIRSRIRFNNLEHVSSSLPLNERFYSIVSRFNRLQSLFIYTEKNNNINNIRFQLQLILDQATHLHSLEFSTWSRTDSEAPFIGLYSHSVRQLDLIRFIFNDQTYHFDEKEIIQLSRSSLGMQIWIQ